MGYSQSRAIIRWWDPETKHLKLCTAAKFDEHSTSTKDPKNLPTSALETSLHPMFEDSPVDVNMDLSPSDKRLGIKLAQCEYFNMPYMTQSLPGSTWRQSFGEEYWTNMWILSIDGNEPITCETVLRILRNAQKRKRTNSIHIIAVKRKHAVIRTSLAENRAAFNQIRFRPIVDAVANKLISTPIKPDTPEHIGQIVNSPHKPEWTEAIFENYEKMHRSSTFSAPFLRSDLPPGTKVLRPRISFKVKLTDMQNQYKLYGPNVCRRIQDARRD